MIKKLQTIFSNQFFLIAFILILSIPVLLPLTYKGFFPTQDFIHVARIYEMDKALKDGQFPVRWVEDFRYGEPLFNFYAPLPFYIGSLIHNLNFGFLDTTKILFGLSFILSAITMFFLAREFFGNLGGVISGILYTYAPYHSVDIYVRGAMSESLALIFFPLVFLAAYKISKQINTKNLLFLSLSLAGLFFTHNIMTVLFTPFFVGWMIFLAWNNKNFKLVKYYILSIALGFGLAATFLLPAFLEKGFVQSDKLITGYFDYRGHFVEIRQFLSDSWGYGASLWGPEDGMTFQVGLVHLAILVLSILIAGVWKKDKKIIMIILFLTSEFLFSLFMQHNKSTPIWTKLSILSYTQFPWRFLGISIFLISFIGGSLGLYLKKGWVIFGAVLIAAIILANTRYFHPESYYLDTIDAHYVSESVLEKDDKLPKDYLPIWVTRIFNEKLTTPRANSGKIEVVAFDKKSTTANLQVKVLEDADIEIPITYFPGWEVKVNEKLINQNKPTEWGLIKFNLPKGDYKVVIELNDTPIRKAGNLLSVISIIIVVLLLFGKKFKFRLWLK